MAGGVVASKMPEVEASGHGKDQPMPQQDLGKLSLILWAIKRHQGERERAREREGEREKYFFPLSLSLSLSER